MLCELDRLARRYNTDPWTVLHWAPERVALASLAMCAATDYAVSVVKQRGHSVQHVVIVE